MTDQKQAPNAVGCLNYPGYGIDITDYNDLAKQRDELAAAALALRSAQRAYMADRGNEKLGRDVASAAEALDRVLAAQGDG